MPSTFVLVTLLAVGGLALPQSQPPPDPTSGSSTIGSLVNAALAIPAFSSSGVPGNLSASTARALKRRDTIEDANLFDTVFYNVTFDDGSGRFYEFLMPENLCSDIVWGEVTTADGVTNPSASGADIVHAITNTGSVSAANAFVKAQAQAVANSLNESISEAICDVAPDACFYSDDACPNGLGGRDEPSSLEARGVEQFSLGEGWWATLILQTVPQAVGAKITYDHLLPAVNGSVTYVQESTVLTSLAVVWIVSIAIVQAFKDDLGILELVVLYSYIVLADNMRRTSSKFWAASWSAVANCYTASGLQNAITRATQGDGPQGLPLIDTGPGIPDAPPVGGGEFVLENQC